jgi:hypothetical protein
MCLRLVALVAVLGGSVFTQTSGIREVTLRAAGNPSVTPAMAVDVLNPVKSDSAGNIYFRVTNNAPEFQEPILKITVDGRRSVMFDARIGSELPEDFIGSEYAVDGGGGIYQIVLTRSFDVYLLHFASSGAIESKVHFNDVFSPRLLAVLPSGDLFVLACPPHAGRSSACPVLFTTIFDAGGRAKSQKHKLTSPAEFQAELGSDGRLYLVSASQILVYSLDGEKRAELPLAGGGNGLQVAGWRIFGDRLFVEWVHEDPGSSAGWISAINPDTGQVTAKYRLSEGVRGGLASVSERGFKLMVRESDGHLSLLTALVPK